ncbi:energy-coupling factor transporter transmembrane component T family protein [Enteractinococcus coprophilus]|uniref:Biotin transport system permease protein n=2 Tax=Enteractinococcus coprophilus TaxID=1027633 RepID=A0A543AMX2_9MICC|nr:biotin transport system permease protein [Enteractinococcus coprophilus]
MLSLYYPAGSFLHRMPTGLKLALLAIGSAALFFLPDSYWSILVVAIPLLGYVLARIPLRIMVTDVLRMAFLLVFLLVTQLIFNEPEVATTVVARLTTIILAAQLFTRTTRIKHLVVTVEKLMTPFEPLGVNPSKVALAVALMLSALGQIMGFIGQVRDAQHARGVRLAPWAWVVPVLVLSLKHADDMADALVVRGLD